MDGVWSSICSAKVLVEDLTNRNANVAYEVGLADGIGRDIILLSQTTSVAFDFLGMRLIRYQNTVAGALALRAELAARLGRYAPSQHQSMGSEVP